MLTYPQGNLCRNCLFIQVSSRRHSCGITGEDGKRYFDFDTFKEKVLDPYPGKVKAIEVKLSQGANILERSSLYTEKNMHHFSSRKISNPGSMV